MKKKIAVLLTCHNRKEKTIACLNSLSEAIKQVKKYNFVIYLVDDGSTDGTSEAIITKFQNVNIIEGDGNLFWNRGMYLAWEIAAREYDYDLYLWLNDDTLLFTNAVKKILISIEQTNFSAIVCGATCSKDKQQVTYSGWIHSQNKPLPPNGTMQQCQIVNGNFLLIPKVVFDEIGNLDWKFRHAIGDFDYGLRAQKAGFKCYVAPDFVGTCEANTTLPKWCLKTTPLIKRFKLLYSPLGYAEPIPFFIYEQRHFGLITALKHFLSINLRALIPQLWK